MKSAYRLKKNSPELKKGAILSVKGCYENGDYEYICSDKEFLTHEEKEEDWEVKYFKETVENQPQWFEKIHNVWLTGEQLKKLKGLLK